MLFRSSAYLDHLLSNHFWASFSVFSWPKAQWITVAGAIPTSSACWPSDTKFAGFPLVAVHPACDSFEKHHSREETPCRELQVLPWKWSLGIERQLFSMERQCTPLFPIHSAVVIGQLPFPNSGPNPVPHVDFDWLIISHNVRSILVNPLNLMVNLLFFVWTGVYSLNMDPPSL